ncbi:MAG: hypothetical protein GYA21_13405 [Myxococcales bacterium]|nr:hypothetical protein [Myxococcales bacterium]
MVDRLPSRTRLSGVLVAIVFLGLALVAWGVGIWLAPAADTAYLALQQRSDDLHRWSLSLLSAAAAGVLVGLSGALLLRRRRWLGTSFRVLLLASPLLAAGTLATVTTFDGLIERRGTEGQWILHESPLAGAVGPNLGRWSESEPGVASDALPDGDFITLDRFTLTRKRPDGTFRWVRERPAQSPAHLLVSGDEVLVIGPGLDYPDDLVVAGFALEDGRERFAYHWLGDRLLPPILERDGLLLCSVRPSSATARLLRWPIPESAWILPLPAPPDIPPRLEAEEALLALRGEVWRLERTTGRVRGRRNACRPPTGEVACDGDRVGAWHPGGEP